MASCLKHPPPRDSVSLHKYSKGNIFLLIFFLICEKWLKRQTLTCSLLTKPETSHPDHSVKNEVPLPLCGSCGGEHPLVKRARRGTYPASISKTRMPRAHQSTARPWPLLWMTSGAKYSGVPHRVHVLRRVRTQTLWLNCP